MQFCSLLVRLICLHSLPLASIMSSLCPVLLNMATTVAWFNGRVGGDGERHTDWFNHGIASSELNEQRGLVLLRSRVLPPLDFSGILGRQSVTTCHSLSSHTQPMATALTALPGPGSVPPQSSSLGF